MPDVLKQRYGALQKVMKFVCASSAIQACFGLNVEIPDSVIFITILYLLTDDILDDPEISQSVETLKLFRRFMNRTVDQVNGYNAEIRRYYVKALDRKRDWLYAIQSTVKMFLQSSLGNAKQRKLILQTVSRLNDAQNLCAIKQSIDFYRKNKDQMMSFCELSDLAGIKGAITFELYSYLLGCFDHEKVAVMSRVGAYYQFADDISDIAEDMESKLFTPAVLAYLFGYKPTSRDYLGYYAVKLYEHFFNGLHRIDVNNFYKHCYAVVTGVQRCISSCKLQSSGFQWQFLHMLENVMLQDIAVGVEYIEMKPLKIGKPRVI